MCTASVRCYCCSAGVCVCCWLSTSLLVEKSWSDSSLRTFGSKVPSAILLRRCWYIFLNSSSDCFVMLPSVLYVSGSASRAACLRTSWKPGRLRSTCAAPLVLYISIATHTMMPAMAITPQIITKKRCSRTLLSWCSKSSLLGWLLGTWHLLLGRELLAIKYIKLRAVLAEQLVEP